MKEQKIKSLPFAKEFTDYFIRRARRVLKITAEEFDHISIDVHPNSRTVWVWLHKPGAIVGRVQFHFDGRCYDKADYRPKTTDQK